MMKNFYTGNIITPFWQVVGIFGFLIFSLAMPFVLNYESVFVFLLPAAMAFLWIVFSVDKGRRGTDLSSALSFKKIGSGQPTWIASAFFVALILCSLTGFLSEKVLDYFGIQYQQEQSLLTELKHTSMAGRITIALLVSFFAPLGEEIAFRRLLFGLLLPYGTWTAMLLSALVFAVLHFYLKGLVSLFLFALILQFIYVKTKNIWVPIHVHVFFNMLSLLCACMKN